MAKSKTASKAAITKQNKALGIDKDKQGEYRVADRWVDTWEGAHAGYALHEVREYWQGAGSMATKIHVNDPVYLHDLPGDHAAHLAWRVYREASAILGVVPHK